MKKLHEVLVVEDDIVDAHTIRRFMSKEGFCNNVDYVMNIAGARTAMKNKLYDLVFLDVELPDGKGLDLAREIYLKSPKTIVICTSGHDGAEVLEEARKSNVLAFLQKPITMEQVQTAADIVTKEKDKTLEIGFGFIGDYDESIGICNR